MGLTKPQNVAVVASAAMRGCFVTVLLWLAGCSRPPPPVDPIVDSGTPTGPSYHSFVRGFVEARCVVCHTQGGHGPFSLQTWADVAPLAPQLVDAVETLRMPPHAPRDGCRAVMSSAVVPVADIALLRQWREGGFREGDAAEYSGPEPLGFQPQVPVGAPTMVITSPDAFAPPLGPDVSNEVIISGAFTGDTWVLATDLRPVGNLEVVHHSNAFLDLQGLPPSGVPGPTAIIGSYAPGYEALVMPPESALFVPAGAGVKLFVHYSTIGVTDGGVPAGRIELRLWTLPAGQRPRYQAFMDAISQSDLLVPALAPRVEVKGERELRYPGSLIAGVFPHMHLLGTAFESNVLHADGGVSCLVDMPNYDFLHQSLILFTPEARLPALDGDLHRMTCVYDNSAEHQPLVGGVPKTSVDVIWGDASTDEMCTDGLLRIVPL